MRLHLPRRVRRKINDRSYHAYFVRLRELRDAQREAQRARAERWPSELPGGETR